MWSSQVEWHSIAGADSVVPAGAVAVAVAVAVAAETHLAGSSWTSAVAVGSH